MRCDVDRKAVTQICAEDSRDGEADKRRKNGRTDSQTDTHIHTHTHPTQKNTR